MVSYTNIKRKLLCADWPTRNSSSIGATNAVNTTKDVFVNIFMKTYNRPLLFAGLSKFG